METSLSKAVRRNGGITMIINNTYPFTLPELPYAYDALEPYIDEETMHYHHDKHFKTYVDKLNKALEPYPEYHSWTLEELLLRLAELPKELKDAVRDNGGGVYNHDMYFDIMAPAGQSVSTAVAEAFGGVENFKKTMKEAALSRFGSGFAWLAKDADGCLQIIALANQDNPLSQGLTPVMLLDVWEHAYYLQYQNRRADYFEAWWRLVDWPEVSRLYTGCLACRPPRP